MRPLQHAPCLLETCPGELRPGEGTEVAGSGRVELTTKRNIWILNCVETKAFDSTRTKSTAFQIWNVAGKPWIRSSGRMSSRLNIRLDGRVRANEVKRRMCRRRGQEVSSLCRTGLSVPKTNIRVRVNHCPLCTAGVCCSLSRQ